MTTTAGHDNAEAARRRFVRALFAPHRPAREAPAGDQQPADPMRQFTRDLFAAADDDNPDHDPRPQQK
jgi:hypothetical protein